MTAVLVAIALCILVEGVFSGSEMGFYSVNRLRLRARVAAGRRDAAVLQRLLEQPDATVITTLIGTNLMIYAATALATELLSTRPNAEFLTTIVMTPIIFVCGEMIPKDIFHRRADALMYVLAGPVDAFRVLVWPAIVVLRRLAVLLSGGVAVKRRSSLLSRTALSEWIAEGRREGVLSPYQQALSANILGLTRKHVASAMFPIDRVAGIPADLSGEELRRAVRDAGHSRLPVFTASRDKVLGILHVLDYARAMDKNPSVCDLVRPAVIVRPTHGIHAALVELQRARQQIAVVVDRDEKPVGIVTMKDLVEEIVGELHSF